MKDHNNKYKCPPVDPPVEIDLDVTNPDYKTNAEKFINYLKQNIYNVYEGITCDECIIENCRLRGYMPRCTQGVKKDEK